MASTCYNIHLHPAVTVKNCLPVDILCGGQYVVGEIVIKPGETLQLPNVEPGVAYIVIRVSFVFLALFWLIFYNNNIFHLSYRNIWRRNGHADVKFKQIHLNFLYGSLTVTTVKQK